MATKTQCGRLIIDIDISNNRNIGYWLPVTSFRGNIRGIIRFTPKPGKIIDDEHLWRTNPELLHMLNVFLV